MGPTVPLWWEEWEYKTSPGQVQQNGKYESYINARVRPLSDLDDILDSLGDYILQWNGHAKLYNLNVNIFPASPVSINFLPFIDILK